MQRRAATTLHLALSLVGAVLYLLFVLPRWWVLTGDFPDTLATVGRIAAGVPIALAAVPVVLNLRQSIKPELGTPELALRLRAWSGVLHVVAGVLLILTAIAEIWTGMGSAGQWLFAVYGAAAAIAVLAALAFYLSFIAAQPPRPPKPAKPVKVKKPRTKRTRTRTEVGVEGGIADTEAAGDTVDELGTTTEDEAADLADHEPAVSEASATATDEPAIPAEDSAPVGGLLNKRPTGKARKGLRR